MTKVARSSSNMKRSAERSPSARSKASARLSKRHRTSLDQESSNSAGLAPTDKHMVEEGEGEADVPMEFEYHSDHSDKADAQNEG